jgi:hypothetical protein
VQAGDERGEGGDEDCTLTQGFWKNHEEVWPVTSLVIGGETYDQALLLEILRTPTLGDASMILGHQLIAALLNVANGATPSSQITQALADAESWMLAHKDSDGFLPYGVSDPAGTALGDLLASFNEGASGTNHCDDPPDTSSAASGSGSGGGTSSGSSGSTGAGGDSGGDCVDLQPCATSAECNLGYSCVQGCCLADVN